MLVHIGTAEHVSCSCDDFTRTDVCHVTTFSQMLKHSLSLKTKLLKAEMHCSKFLEIVFACWIYCAAI